MLRRLAEDSNAYTPLRAGERRLEDRRYVVFLGAGRTRYSTVVQRLRLGGEDVGAAVEELRALLDRLGRASSTWEVGDSATPPGLVERLQELGLRPDSEPLAVGMVLDAEPPPGPEDVRVEPVRTLDEFRAHHRIAAEAFGLGPGPSPEEVGIDWLREQASALDTRLYLAWLDGEPVATARATFADVGAVLNAGSTLPAARGRGAYRALVAARWRDAVERGTPALVTQAGALSRPILLRLGFRELASISILVDEQPH